MHAEFLKKTYSHDKKESIAPEKQTFSTLIALLPREQSGRQQTRMEMKTSDLFFEEFKKAQVYL